jgi:hypothetical protein
MWYKAKEIYEWEVMEKTPLQGMDEKSDIVELLLLLKRTSERGCKQESARRISMHLQEKETSMRLSFFWSSLSRNNWKDYRNHTALIVVAQNGKANVAQTITSNKSEVWKWRMDRKQNSLHVAASAGRPM